MTPEQISEFEKRMHEEDANCGLAREILDALEAAQAEIADLKRGGVDAALAFSALFLAVWWGAR